MKGAIFFSGQYGSTAQYASWIGEATGLPVFDIKDRSADPSRYDFVVLGSSVITYKLTIRKWVQKHLSIIKSKPIILFTVSGAGAGSKLDGWVEQSLPADITTKMDHVALRGRLDHTDVSWWLKLMLNIVGKMNRDPSASKDEMEGFDYMDKSSIEPIVKLIESYHSSVTSADKNPSITKETAPV